MGINIGININDDYQPFTDLILDGRKTIETRNTPTLRPYVGKRVGIISTSKKRTAKLVGYVDIIDEIEYTNEKQFNSDYNKHLVGKDSPFYIKDVKYGYVLSNPERIEPRDIYSKGIISRSLIKEDMEISKEKLEKLLKTAHNDIARKTGTGSQISLTSDVIQKWIDDNPQKVKEITKGELEEDAEDVNFMQEVTKSELEEAKKARTKLRKKKKGDRCTRIAKSKYDVWPSAYASGAVVKCRQGKIWKGLKEEEETLFEIKKADFSKEKEQGLHGWFARQGGKGKSKGWVDCNTCRDGKCKSCGRKEGEKRSKYPACRPTPSACKSKGRGDSWGKKS